MKAMPEKKLPYRFTIGFNAEDPAHRQAAEVLNRQGRRKAQFLVNAILYYTHCTDYNAEPLPEIEATVEPWEERKEALEDLVLRVLEEHGHREQRPEIAEMGAADSPQTIAPMETRGILDTVNVAAIADSLAAFRGK